MDDAHRNDQHDVSIERRAIECVEVYVPKKLESLSELYRYLREKMVQREAGAGSVQIDGFSLYEVDGAFYGDQIDQERTLVIRLLFLNQSSLEGADLEQQVSAIGREIATTVALKEEEIWICHYPQRMLIFRPPGGKQA
jgi:hypothetical protein